MSANPGARKQKSSDNPESALPLLRHSAVNVKTVVMWIHLGGTAEKFLSSREITIRRRDHAGVEKKVRVFGSQCQRFLNLACSFGKLPVAIQGPCHRVMRVNAVAIFRIFSRPFESLVRL